MYSIACIQQVACRKKSDHISRQEKVGLFGFCTLAHSYHICACIQTHTYTYTCRYKSVRPIAYNELPSENQAYVYDAANVASEYADGVTWDELSETFSVRTQVCALYVCMYTCT